MNDYELLDDDEEEIQQARIRITVIIVRGMLVNIMTVQTLIAL